MNEEEKKAIENIEELKTLFEIDDKKDFEATPLAQKEIVKDLKTLLNLIDKMKNCINILDDELKERNKAINEKEIIIEKLQKENEELKSNNEKYIIHLMAGQYKTVIEIAQNDINQKWIQKVKDKIEHYQKLQDNYIEKYDEINEGLQAMINALQELLEGRK